MGESISLAKLINIFLQVYLHVPIFSDILQIASIQIPTMQKIQAKQIEKRTYQIKQPSCLCCRDSGYIKSHFLPQYVEGNPEVPFICRRKGCEGGEKAMKSYLAPDCDRLAAVSAKGVQFAKFTPKAEYQQCFDIRLGHNECEAIHQLELKDKIFVQFDISKLVRKLGM